MSCNTTHHLACERVDAKHPGTHRRTPCGCCDCRDHKVAVLIKASLDAAKELDDLQSIAHGLSEEQRHSIRAVVERTYAAVEALGVEIGGIEHPHPPHRQCGCSACAVSFEEEEIHL